MISNHEYYAPLNIRTRSLTFAAAASAGVGVCPAVPSLSASDKQDLNNKENNKTTTKITENKPNKNNTMKNIHYFYIVTFTTWEVRIQLKTLADDKKACYVEFTQNIQEGSEEDRCEVKGEERGTGGRRREGGREESEMR